MGTSYRWHPGTDRLTGRWALTTALQPDELMSSWLVRLAHRQGCDVLSLTGNLWPGWRCWTQDLDRGMSDEHIRPLSVTTGLSAQACRAATLGSIIERVADISSRTRTRWPWTTTLGSRNTRRRGGLQFCPGCLVDDAVPHYRLHWRLVWHTACDRHGCALLDRCPGCQAPLEPHRVDIRTGSFTSCARCGLDLRAAPTEAVDPATLAFQAAADRAVQDGLAKAFGHPIPAPDWFALSAFLTTFLRRSSYESGGPLRRVLDVLEIDSPSLGRADRGVDLESLRVDNRHALFTALGSLLELDPDALASALCTAAITRQALCPKGQALPGILDSMASALPERTVPERKRTTRVTQPSGPRSRRAVETMMATLERRIARGKR